MAAFAASVAPQWIPEDDLLLKNAIEGGASLEALAKGAVRFSRKFTLTELRDRWYALLYDPVISKEASTKMFELELSDTNTNSKVSSADVSAKRKVDSVRRLYYVMRKKSRSHAGSFIGQLGSSCRDSVGFGDHDRTHFGFVGEKCCGEVNVGVPSFEHDSLGGIVSDNVVDGIVDYQRCGSLPESSNLFPAEEELLCPLAMWEMVGDISVSALPIGVSKEDKGQEQEVMHCNDVGLDSNERMHAINPEALLQDKHDLDVLHNSTAISECDYADISELLLVAADTEEAIDKSCNDGILATSPNDCHGTSPNVKDSHALVSNKSLETPASPCPLVAMAEGLVSGDVEQHVDFNSEISLASFTPAANIDNCDVEMECILNTEDAEIPCNDDVLLRKEFTSAIGRTSKISGCLSSSGTNLKVHKHEQSLGKKEENPAQSIIISQTKELAMLPVTIPGHQSVGCGAKCQSPEDVAFRLASNGHRDSNQCRTAQASLGVAKVGMSLHAGNATDLPLYGQACSPKQITSIPEEDPSMSSDEESESDDGVPSYSEIEAMILQMDLCPDDTDYYNYREVSRYQNEDTRRTIIRLEQCAQSSMQRSIASRGALAVFYGHRIKHYIRETEVILGRATDDMEVDIDLGREGPANKISRRQALIKLEADGSFLLRNLGKVPVYLNGQEIVTRQSSFLGSSSLIEIGEMAFMFEINSKCVTQYLANAMKNRQGMKFEWKEGDP
ncbi:uncharacterized protein LOC126678776 [Mercurialis annua]|uniref:uncharacterized protein LOC126678776 n=1 Tax=Mercurialis annua TaxID=3986 RepID=UPI00215E3FD2|nr:uncharacterized protein LOC126678776 [Mercurialis annua]